MKNEPVAKTEKKLTPHEFWTSVKQIAELQIKQAKVNRLMGFDQDIGLLSEVATLSSLLQELTGCPLCPLHGSEQLASCTSRKGIDTQHQIHKRQTGNLDALPGDRRSTPECNQDRR